MGLVVIYFLYIRDGYHEPITYICPGQHILIAVRRKKIWSSLYFPVSYYNSMINGADYVSQDGSPFHDPGPLIKSNKKQSCDYMATHRAHLAGVIPR